jgi:hypothetical protein
LLGRFAIARLDGFTQPLLRYRSPSGQQAPSPFAIQAASFSITPIASLAAN